MCLFNSCFYHDPDSPDSYRDRDETAKLQFIMIKQQSFINFIR